MVKRQAHAKRIFLLGATGGIGGEVIDQALLRGHRVTAFVRSPQKLAAPREGLSVVGGDPHDVAALQAALADHDAVVSSLGPPGLGPTTLVGDCAKSTVAAMAAAGVRRILIVGAAVLFEDNGILSAIFRGTFLRNIAKDSAEMERVLAASDLEWTVPRPPRLTNGPLTRRYRVADGRMPEGVRMTMSRADVAHFLLDEIERPAHVRRIVGMASSKGS